MNLKTFHKSEKLLDVKPLFRAEKGQVTAIHLKEGGVLKKHTTPVPALLVCITGKVRFEDEKDQQTELSAGDFIHIEPGLVHWVNGIEETQLILIR